MGQVAAYAERVCPSTLPFTPAIFPDLTLDLERLFP